MDDKYKGCIEHTPRDKTQAWRVWRYNKIYRFCHTQLEALQYQSNGYKTKGEKSR